MLASMKGFKYEKLNLLEWMHNLGRAWDCFLNILVGIDHTHTSRAHITRAHTHIVRAHLGVDEKFDHSSRLSSEALGVFPDIWNSKIVYLSQVHLTHISTSLQHIQP